MGDTPWPGGVSPAQPRQAVNTRLSWFSETEKGNIWMIIYPKENKIRNSQLNLGIELQLHMGMDQS